MIAFIRKAMQFHALIKTKIFCFQRLALLATPVVSLTYADFFYGSKITKLKSKSVKTKSETRNKKSEIQNAVAFNY